MSLALLLGSIAQLVIAILLIAVLWLLIGILKNVREISEHARRGSDIVSNDLFRFRSAIIDESAAFWTGFKSFVSMVPNAFGFGTKKRSRKTSTPADESA